jgi:hypothetical protein
VDEARTVLLLVPDLISHRSLVAFLFIINATQAAAVIYMSW